MRSNGKYETRIYFHACVSRRFLNNWICALEMGVPRLIYSIESIAEEIDDPDSVSCIVNYLGRNVDKFVNEYYNPKASNALKRAALLTYNSKDLKALQECLEKKIEEKKTDGLDREVMDRMVNLRDQLRCFNEKNGAPGIQHIVGAWIYLITNSLSTAIRE